MPYAGSFTITQKPSAKDGASDLYALNSQFAVHFVHEELLNAAYTAKEELTAL